MSIHENIKRFFENEKNIVAVYLFGSYADGRERDFSDVDLGILFDNRDREAVNRLLDKYLVALSRSLRKDVHLTAMDFAGETILKQIFENCFLHLHFPRLQKLFLHEWLKQHLH